MNRISISSITKIFSFCSKITESYQLLKKQISDLFLRIQQISLELEPTDLTLQANLSLYKQIYQKQPRQVHARRLLPVYIGYTCAVKKTSWVFGA